MSFIAGYSSSGIEDNFGITRVGQNHDLKIICGSYHKDGDEFQGIHIRIDGDWEIDFAPGETVDTLAV